MANPQRETPRTRCTNLIWIDTVPCLFFTLIMGLSSDDFTYRIDLWDDAGNRTEEVIALVSDFYTARSAYEEAVKRRPGKLITLRQKARVIRKSR